MENIARFALNSMLNTEHFLYFTYNQLNIL